MADSPTHVWWLYGAPCVGKSATAWELFAHQLEGEPRGYFDIDQLGICYPQPHDNAERRAMRYRAAGVLVRHLARAGARTVVVSGVLEPGSHDEVVEALRPAAVTFCRLRADPDVLRPRLQRRYGPQDVARALAEAGVWDELDNGQPVVESARAVGEVAGQALAVFQDATRVSSSTASQVPMAPAVEPPDPAGAPSRAVLICGATGVGKSTLAFGLTMQGWATGRSCAFLDLQQIAFVDGVEPLSDDGSSATAAAVADLWQTYRRAGAADLVLNGDVESAESVERYRQALGATPLLVVRLRAGREQLRRRLTARSRGGGGPELAGDGLRGIDAAAVDAVLDAAITSQHRMDAAEVADIVVETGEDDADVLVERLVRIREEHLLP
ncbi:hypothetical protein H9657_11520 [Cellulomonas sp. Sa3CUA2]|uniref:Uncharacterized protein n=1 Tax=Cellulomonas avistercoris TaxID=2762242 RepID=A0ABR8QEP4_9CELL|nr:hypothetical protein [Cellulomonas avistercoris]MBD7918903.1 hypothetical protein [Cellulomonas avistercoris]